MSPQEKWNAWYMYTLCTLWIQLFQPGIQIGFSSLVESQITDTRQPRVCRMPWQNQVVTCLSYLSFAPKLKFYGFFFCYIPSSPNSWTAFSKILFNPSLIPEAVPAHPGILPMVVLQEYTGCLGNGQMSVAEAKLWFGHMDPFLSVTLS